MTCKTSSREGLANNLTNGVAKTFSIDPSKVFGVSHKGMTPITDQQN